VWLSALRRKCVFFEAAKKNDYWTCQLAAEGHDPRRPWLSVNNVVRRGSESGLPSAPVKHTADDFQKIFEAKVQTIRSATSGPSSAAVDASQSDSVATTSSESSQRPILMTWREI